MLKNNGFHNRHSPILRAFSPLSLFSSGAPGAWYDPSDMSTLFQDSAGTTPVTAVEQPVGLMLDKSQGLVLGPELVTNGSFTTDTDWTKGTGWTISGGTASITVSVGSNNLSQANCLPAVGKFAEVTFTVVGTTIGNISIFLGSGATEVVFVAPAAGQYKIKGSVVGSTTLFIQAKTGTTVAVDNVSVKELPGNHAFQSTSASRPVLSARYNLLTKTEQFDDVAWTKAAGVTVTANTDIAPNGTMTADTVTSGANQIDQSITVSQSTLYTDSLYFKKTSGAAYQPGMYLLFSGGTLVIYAVRLNTDTGVATAVSAGGFTTPSSFSVTEDGNYWKLSITGNSNNNTTGVLRLYPNLNAAGGSGAGSQVIWGASLVPANQSTLPYQRVNTATDYNTTGFLPYLKFDGVDDSLSTNSISFTATDKMSVFAGVRKLSDAAYGTVVELSVNNDSSNGSFAIFAPNLARWDIRLKGTGSYGTYNPETYTAPVASVIALLGNLAGSTLADKLIPRVNGVIEQENATAGTIGGGNMGNYPLYIGRRGGSSLPFNGQLYGLIIVGKAVTAGELSSTETYVNQKTGAY